MPSKTSKPTRTPPSQKRAEPGCSEFRLKELAAEIAAGLKPGDRVLLEGEMGTGKSTFARFLLEALGSRQTNEGSPTFAIAHEYRTAKGDAAHLDFYRLRSEAEIDQAGVSAYFWERDLIVLTEWLSLRPKFEAAVLSQNTETETRKFWRIHLSFGASPTLRDVKWETWGSP